VRLRERVAVHRRVSKSVIHARARARPRTPSVRGRRPSSGRRAAAEADLEFQGPCGQVDTSRFVLDAHRSDTLAGGFGRHCGLTKSERDARTLDISNRRTAAAARAVLQRGGARHVPDARVRSGRRGRDRAAAANSTAWPTRGSTRILRSTNGPRCGSALRGRRAVADRALSRRLVCRHSRIASTQAARTVLAEIQIVRYHVDGRYIEHRDSPAMGATHARCRSSAT